MKKTTQSRAKTVKSIARTRVGQPKATRVESVIAPRKSPKHKKRPEEDD